MARELPYIAAINEAIHLEMERDDSVLFFGQNMANTENEPFVDAFGKDRVRVTPISETAEIGMAVGAALAGYRPVVELYMAEFMLVAMDQVVNEAPRFRYMSGGQVKVPLVLKAGYGFTAGWAGQHTGTIYGMFMGVPGLKVAVPSTAADAKGLMATAIRDDNPVAYFHHYLLTLEHGEVPEGEHLVPFGEAAVRRSGGDVTIVAIGAMVGTALAAAETLAGEGIEAEVIDPRTLAPLDLPRSSSRSRRPAGSCSSTRRRVTVGLGGDRGRGRRRRVRVAEGADQAGDRARHDDRLQRAARGVRAARRGEGRGRGPQVLGSSRSRRRRVAGRDDQPPPAVLDGALALDVLATMWRIRLFEERVGQLKRADEVHGLIHLSVGQEGVAAGVCRQLRDDDAVYSGHRAHGHAVRERSIETIGAMVENGIRMSGFEEVGLLSLSSADHTEIAEVATGLADRYEGTNVSLSLPSTRVDAFNVTLANEFSRNGRRSGLTFAPEGGSERMRKVINKAVDEEDLIRTVATAYSHGWRQVKLYFMCGLPDRDRRGRARDRRPREAR